MRVFYITLLVVTIVVISCKKEEDPLNAHQRFKFINDTEYEIDSVIIYRDNMHGTGYDYLLEFDVIPVGGETAFLSAYNLPVQIKLKAVVDTIEYLAIWRYPGFVYDVENKVTTMYAGYYTFTIFELDTSNYRLNMGLTYFEASE